MQQQEQDLWEEAAAAELDRRERQLMQLEQRLGEQQSQQQDQAQKMVGRELQLRMLADR